jgi:hypothetical protein
MVTTEIRPEIITATAIRADTQIRKQVPGRFVIDAVSGKKDSRSGERRKEGK